VVNEQGRTIVLKKILLGVSTFAIAILLFAVYQWQDTTPTRTSQQPAPSAAPMTQMAADSKTLKVRNVDVPPGEKPFVVVYDDRGRPKIRFRSEKWHPVAENEWHMTRPEVRLLLPGGQLVDATANEGQVVVAKEEDNNYDPKRGWLRGNVHILIDRTDEQWRKKNPDRARPEQHPEYVVHLWLEDVDFKLDIARLESKGAIRVQSHDATVEGTGLVLAWNEVDRRIDLLEIAKGKRMELRRDAGLVEFAMPGTERRQSVRNAVKPQARLTRAAEVKTAGTQTAAKVVEAKAAESRPVEKSIEDLFLDVTKDKNLKPKRDQIDTYTAVFGGPVTVAQKRGETDLGKLTGDALELLFDFGEAQKEAADVKPPEAAAAQGGTATSAPAVAHAGAPPTSQPAAEQPRIELLWPGKLTLRPVAAKKSDQTGNRFHAIATGHVQVLKGTSTATCDRLEFHNETEQAWLSGSPVHMRDADAREMSGEKIFYDRRAGLARIDGAGSMTDTRELAGNVSIPGGKGSDARVPAEPAPAPEKKAERAVVRWSKSVELKFGTVRQPRIDPRSSQAVVEEKEYLRHALFVGDVDMSQASRSLKGDEIELVFAEPPGQEQADPPEQLARAIAHTLSTDADKQTEIAAQLGKMIAELVSTTTRPDAQQAVAERIGRAIAGHAAAGPEARAAIAENVSKQIGGLVTADPSARPAAAEELARAIARLGPTKGDAQKAQVGQLTKAIGRLVSTEPSAQDVVSNRLDRMLARGHVRFQSSDDVVTANELTVGMTVDAEGKNVPAHAEARGAVSASQKERKISAKNRLMVELASVPAPPGPPLDRQMVAARARSRGIDPATIDWEALEARRKDRRELAVVHLEAFGDVRAIDPGEKLNLSADELRCWMPDGRQIEQASVVGTDGREAEVELGDYYVRGPRVKTNVKTQCAEVPSPGILRFRSYEDLNGEHLDKPVPVTISWSKNMVIDGEHNAGVFTGSVHAVSRDNMVDCQELRVAFADIQGPASAGPTSVPATAPASDRYWIFDPLVKQLTGAQKEKRAAGPVTGMRKRPIRLVAIGDARASSTTLDEKNRLRILSSMQIDGPQLALDLENDQLSVTGAGHLLIQDYRTPQARRRTAPSKIAPARDPFGAGLNVESPSQTLFTWQNAMSFFARRDLAVFDRDVTMTHLSGSAIKLGPQLAQAMKLDISRLQAAKGRRAGLRCDNLIVEFLRDPSAKRRSDDPTPLAGATELRQLRATGNARLEEGTRSIDGELITFNRTTNLIRVFGSPSTPALLLDQYEPNGKWMRWWGDSVTYNLETGNIEAEHSVVSATGG
jgi:lipopolysaccharide export system protein LptA